MPAVGVHDDTFDKLRLLARAWSITEGEVISRLLVEFQQTNRRSEEATSQGGVAIHAIYEGMRIMGAFDPVTKAVTITSGSLAGQTYRSPSGAAVALVNALNPSVKPNRSGWSFWWVSETGEMLRALRR